MTLGSNPVIRPSIRQVPSLPYPRYQQGKCWENTLLKRIKAKILKESMKRGEHNIENQMIFKSNPGFIFHDSRGFESGALEETEKVKNFIKTRAASSSLAEQLHAVW
ncbi:hypothetical protein B0H13DRAFT_2682981 [Mycena leptocephala]|nr:hypothetical protein B0H13DRAFT_2682981 [Mycena leptocephala]